MPDPDQAVPTSPDRHWFDVEQLAAHLEISKSSAYRLAHELSGGRKKYVGLRVSRAAVERYMAKPELCAAPSKPRRPGTPVAIATDDDDNEEVLPGLTRRQLKDRVGF